MAEQQEQVTGGLPIVVHVDGEVAAGGRAIALRIVRKDQDPVDICVRTEDVQYLVSILLTLGCEAKRLQPASEPDGPPSGAIPLPLRLSRTFGAAGAGAFVAGAFVAGAGTAARSATVVAALVAAG